MRSLVVLIAVVVGLSFATDRYEYHVGDRVYVKSDASGETWHVDAVWDWERPLYVLSKKDELDLKYLESKEISPVKYP